MVSFEIIAINLNWTYTEMLFMKFGRKQLFFITVFTSTFKAPYQNFFFNLSEIMTF